jgi:RNA polymerase sigma factor (sigma-70 family)
VTDEELAASIQQELAAAAAARERCDEKEAKQHERRALELKHELWARLEPRVRLLAGRFAHYAKRAGMEVDDFVQEAYIKFDTVVLRYNPNRGAKVWTWLEKVLTNLFIQLGRGQREEPREDVGELTTLGEGESFDRELRRARILQVIDSLLPDDPNRERKILVFKLYWIEGWTIPELAQRFGVAVGTIHKWLKQVEDAFREEFPKRYPEYFPENGA